MLPFVLLLLLLAGISCICPPECECELDVRGRRQVMCTKGGMQVPIPITQMDAMLEVLKISAPDHNQNALTIGPIFQQFSQLEEIHIVKSNIPAIGKHSFWGVPTLKMLNLTQNNISQVLESNFQVLEGLALLPWQGLVCLSWRPLSSSTPTALDRFFVAVTF
ncbi:hypothetical protein J6590_062263 [Homalodisca vitripennis]|nr:hypothetical protein J6590_062263 [Homalodisca vitripennis]